MRTLGPTFGNGTTWLAQWGRFRNALLDLVLPPRCAGCGRTGSLWCADCHSGVQVIHDPVCPHCGRPQRSDSLCPQCRHAQRPREIDGIRSAVIFEGPLRQAIHHLKYSGRSSLAEPLGSFLDARWQAGPLPKCSASSLTRCACDVGRAQRKRRTRRRSRCCSPWYS